METEDRVEPLLEFPEVEHPRKELMLDRPAGRLAPAAELAELAQMSLSVMVLLAVVLVVVLPQPTFQTSAEQGVGRHRRYTLRQVRQGRLTRQVVLDSRRCKSGRMFLRLALAVAAVVLPLRQMAERAALDGMVEVGVAVAAQETAMCLALVVMVELDGP